MSAKASHARYLLVDNQLGLQLGDSALHSGRNSNKHYQQIFRFTSSGSAIPSPVSARSSPARDEQHIKCCSARAESTETRDATAKPNQNTSSDTSFCRVRTLKPSRTSQLETTRPARLATVRPGRNNNFISRFIRERKERPETEKAALADGL